MFLNFLEVLNCVFQEFLRSFQIYFGNILNILRKFIRRFWGFGGFQGYSVLSKMVGGFYKSCSIFFVVLGGIWGALTYFFKMFVEFLGLLLFPWVLRC